MKLFMSGQKFSLKRDPPSVRKAKEFLDKSKDGELFTLQQVAAAIGCTVVILRDYHACFSDYRAASNSKMYYYGKPRTIAELKRQIAKENK